jgi:hypothetical protein
MLARPPVPPITASFSSQARRAASASITSFGLPYEWGGREELSPFGDRAELAQQGFTGSAGLAVTGYGGGHKREGSEMGDSVYGGIDGRR